MELKYTRCEMCQAVAKDEKQLRREHWLQIHGGSLSGVSVWLDKPREKDGGFMLTVGFRDRQYDFCSIDCLAKALRGTESI